MSLHADQPGKFLFGCLIVVLCCMIGAGQFLGSRDDKSADHAIEHAAIQQTAADHPFSLSPVDWPLHKKPLAFYCFLSAVIVWIASVMGRQIVVASTAGMEGGSSAPRSGNSVVWSAVDFVVSMVILASASFILARALGWFFALLIGVTTILCYFLAYGPRQLAHYFRQLGHWLDQRQPAAMVNGDLPLGELNSDFDSRLILPVSWWQTMRQQHRAIGVAPVALVLFGFGAMVTVALMALSDGQTDPSAHASRPGRTPTLLSIPNSRVHTTGTDVAVQSLQLLPIQDREVEVGERLIITAKLVNRAAIEGDVQFAIEPEIPPGARFYADSGVLVWTPSEPGKYQFTLRARGDNSNQSSAETNFAIVVRPSGRTLELSDIPDQSVSAHELMVVPVRLKNRSRLHGVVRFRLAAPIPEGAAIDNEAGVITWTPTRPGTHQITAQAVANVPGNDRAEKSFMVVVHPAARAPELIEMSDRTAQEGELLYFMAQVKDVSELGGRLQYDLGEESPHDASIDADSGLFSWRPTTAGVFDVTIIARTDAPTALRDQKSFRVAVTPRARPPVLAPVDDRAVNEHETLVVPIKVKNPGQPLGSLRYDLSDEHPEGSTIDARSGVFTWTPIQPGTYPIAVRCESLASGMSDQATFTIVVHEVSEAPELAEIGNKIVKPGDSLIVPIKIKDAGRPAGQLMFTLSPDFPAGAQIDADTGVIRWHVDTETLPGDYPITVRVRNSVRPALSDQLAFHVTVLESDQPLPVAESSPPLVLPPVDDHIVDAGTLVRFMIRCNGESNEAGQLDHSLAPGAPAGASINSRTGLFTWRPNAEQAMHQYPITIQVRDTEDSSRHAERRFYVKVNGVEEPTTIEEPVQPTRRSNPFESQDGPDLVTPPPSARSAEPPDIRPSPLEEIEREEESQLVPIPLSDPDYDRPEVPNIESSTADEPDELLINSIGMRLAPIVAGTFMMGSRESAADVAPLHDSEAARFRDEQPQHPVRISRPFYMGRFEVTIGQFQHFIDDTGYKTDAERDGEGAYAFNARSHEFQWGKQFNWLNTGWSQTSDHPVVNVSWNDAAAFCRWLSDKEGHVYRLPTEAEWEYACRAGTTTRYASGDSVEELVATANLGDESFRRTIRQGYSGIVPVAGHEGSAFTMPVGKFQPNAFNLCDMHGNVFEWCGDWYGSNYYEQSPLVDPAGPASGTKHVIRGGSFFNSPFYSRSSFRNGFTPQTRVPYLGFRVVMEMETEPESEQEAP